jgi:GntR family transcriptional regulator
MILEVDGSDPTPVYEQIRGQVVDMVVAGTLPAGTRLPTIRQLATDLGLAKGTVAKAYETLLRDGIVRSAGRNGTVVADDQLPAPADRDAQLEEAARSYAVRVRQLGVDTEQAVEAFERATRQLGRVRS